MSDAPTLPRHRPPFVESGDARRSEPSRCERVALPGRDQLPEPRRHCSACLSFSPLTSTPHPWANLLLLSQGCWPAKLVPVTVWSFELVWGSSMDKPVLADR